MGGDCSVPRHRPFLVEAGRNAIDYELLDVVSHATPHDARRLRVRFEEWLRTAGAPPPLVDDLTLAVYEALANAVEHAYDPDHPHPTLRLQAQLNHTQVLITISDNGCWRTPRAPGQRGRGLDLMRELATEMDLHATPEGTTVRLRTPLRPDPYQAGTDGDSGTRPSTAS